MKLIIAIVQDEDEVVLSKAFQEADFQATKLSSTGGFLRSGNTTFLIGTEAKRVEAALDIIRDCSQERTQTVVAPSNFDVDYNMSQNYPVQVEVGGAIVFVLPIDAFYRF
ncbi:hypothetical protein CL176_00250 [Suicoccus acidiformans]|uniref:Transcriptional regulator n=1 Tax=Suicoccus acidiformans TaxID=2036206 RepID=A0A347WHM4_9LACT|nr:cyclic-di-AMP receptor [Suicoccus acidiformans]AXY24581.1 hypothetical protein CL176_00250 [Suicoccus acidiformans]